jgi:asparagine synthase (glutamine-hydrolysing)
MVLAAGGALHAADLASARRLGAQALAWDADPQLLGMAWLASVEDDLVKAGASDADQRQARATRWREAVLQRTIAVDVHAPPTQMSRARDEAVRLRAEVLRQRELIEKLRAGAHAAMRQLSREGDQALINRVIEARLTYLSQAKMMSLARTCRALEEQRIPGRFVEAGCALGGSAILIASLKNATRPFSVYDVFGMIPPPSELDTPDVHERYRTIVEGRSTGLGGDRYYGYHADLLEIVKGNFVKFGIEAASCGIEFVQGMVQDTVQGDDPVALAHLDLDWYEPVTVCLERLWPRLSMGGSIIVDDYHDWGGCQHAVDRFLGLMHGGYFADDSAGSLKITKVPA